MSEEKHDAESLLSTRHRVLVLLSTPRCSREIRERISGAKRKGIETAFHRLAAARLIYPVTTHRQSRLFARTYLGGLLVKELTNEPDPVLPLLTPEELEARSWVQAGAYRRWVLRALLEPMSVKQIRRLVIAQHERTGVGHVQRTLRGFESRVIAQRDTARVWRLTPLGEKFRTIELDRLLEGPVTLSSAWRTLA